MSQEHGSADGGGAVALARHGNRNVTPRELEHVMCLREMFELGVTQPNFDLTLEDGNGAGLDPVGSSDGL
jgi:hypothetical protein